MFFLAPRRQMAGSRLERSGSCWRCSSWRSTSGMRNQRVPPPAQLARLAEARLDSAPFLPGCPFHVSTLIAASPLAIKFLLGSQLQSSIRSARSTRFIARARAAGEGGACRAVARTAGERGRRWMNTRSNNGARAPRTVAIVVVRECVNGRPISDEISPTSARASLWSRTPSRCQHRRDVGQRQRQFDIAQIRKDVGRHDQVERRAGQSLGDDVEADGVDRAGRPSAAAAGSSSDGARYRSGTTGGYERRRRRLARGRRSTGDTRRRAMTGSLVADACHQRDGRVAGCGRR